MGEQCGDFDAGKCQFTIQLTTYNQCISIYKVYYIHFVQEGELRVSVAIIWLYHSSGQIMYSDKL